MASLEMTYFNPLHPGSYSGVDKFYRSIDNYSRINVKQWLKGQDAYTLHKPVHYKFKRNKVIVSGIDSQWDLDLIDMIKYRQSNDGYQYILVAIDIFSRYAWTRALKTKTGKDVKVALNEIFQDRKPSTIRTDKGSEFKNKVVQTLFKQEHIHHFVTHNEVKANYVERLNRTLKIKLSRYFSHKQSHRWINVLNDITHSYNNTYHRSIKQPPQSVTNENQELIWKINFATKTYKSDNEFLLKLGDLVRISHIRRVFQREYDERYTDELFRISSRRKRVGLNVYILKDLQDEPVLGTFYEPELQHVTPDLSGVFKIEKVLKSRKRRGHEKEYLVKWRGYPKKFNSWVKSSDMQEI